MTLYPATIPLSDGSKFSARNPKADSIRVVKLTAANLTEVAGEVLRKLGKGFVEVAADRLYIDAAAYDPGTWLVEDYDYANHTVLFRPATVTDREKYDLR